MPKDTKEAAATPPTQPAGDHTAAPLPLMTRHRTIFDQARAHIEKILGKSPTPEELMRLWLATATPWDVTRIFENAVLDLTGSDLIPMPGDDHQTILAL